MHIIEYFSDVLKPVQVLGYAALILAIISFQKNTPKGMIVFQLLANILFTVHFFMLGAITGAALNMMSAVRSVIYYNSDKKWAAHPVWIPVFSIIAIAIGLCSWNGWQSILPVLGTLFYTIGFKMKTAKLVRAISLPSSPCWMIYNALNHSYAGIITESYVIISIIVGMLRFDIRERNIEKN